MTSREELVDLITSTAVDALDWHWAAAPGVPSPEDAFRHVAEAIYEALPLAEIWQEAYGDGRDDEADLLDESPNPYGRPS